MVTEYLKQLNSKTYVTLTLNYIDSLRTHACGILGPEESS
jgi:hypothetical protein